jgi:hypothetical protein
VRAASEAAIIQGMVTKNAEVTRIRLRRPWYAPPPVRWLNFYLPVVFSDLGGFVTPALTPYCNSQFTLEPLAKLGEVVEIKQNGLIVI